MKLSIRKSVLVGLCVLPAGAVIAQAPVSSTAQQTGTIEQRVERIERILQSQSLLEILQQVRQLQQDINTLRGELETQNYNLDQLSQRQRNLYADIDQRLQRLEGGDAAPLDMTTGAVTPGAGTDSPPIETLSAIQGGSEMSSDFPAQGGLQVEVISNAATAEQQQRATPGVNGNAAIISPVPATSTEQREQQTLSPGQTTDLTAGRPANADPVQLQAEYQQAFNLLRQSLYDQAIRAFQQFLANHPNDRYSDSAQYWLAETYYVKREFQPALDEYNKLVTNFPESQKTPDAMLKIGFTLIELGQLNNAREHLQNLIRQQPDSTVARMADERLKQLGAVTQQTMPAEVN